MAQSGIEAWDCGGGGRGARERMAWEREVSHSQPEQCCPRFMRCMCSRFLRAQKLKSETANQSSGLHVLSGHGASVSACAFSRDCSSCSGDTRLKPTALLMALGRQKPLACVSNMRTDRVPSCSQGEVLSILSRRTGGSCSVWRPAVAVLYPAYLGISSRSRVVLDSLGLESLWRWAALSSATAS
jgi:hypothetical protein